MTRLCRIFGIDDSRQILSVAEIGKTSPEIIFAGEVFLWRVKKAE